MIYDKTPDSEPYEHYSHLPYAKEPLKAFYVTQRLLTTVALVPCWTAYYGVLPKSARPRDSWTLKQLVYVNFTRRISKVTEVAGVTFNTRDPDSEPLPSTLKETRFEWAPPLHNDLREGVVNGITDSIPFKRVGVYIWPKERPKIDFQERPLVGLFMHGGGYCHMSAHESSRTSNIPRRLMREAPFAEIYNVEYRLLQHAPFPAVLIDAATAYAHILSVRPRARVVLIGDSSGGNLVLALARWIRDQEKLVMPAGLLLLSPSCDASHAFPVIPTEYVPRPHADTDYLTDTPEPRALLQRTFLGFKHRPKHVGWKSFEREGEKQMDSYFKGFGIKHQGSALGLQHKPSDSVLPAINIQNGGSLPEITQDSSSSSASAASGSLSSTVASRQSKKQRKQLEKEWHQAEVDEEERHLQAVVHSEYVSPASPQVLTRWGHEVDMYDGSRDGPDLTATIKQLGLPPSTPVMQLPDHLRPANVSGCWPGLFARFPKSMVVTGDAERLTTEVKNLTRAMMRDGVEVESKWVKDAVHDVLMIPPGWWDEKIRDDVWKDVGNWCRNV